MYELTNRQYHIGGGVWPIAGTQRIVNGTLYTYTIANPEPLSLFQTAGRRIGYSSLILHGSRTLMLTKRRWRLGGRHSGILATPSVTDWAIGRPMRDCTTRESVENGEQNGS